MILIQVADEVDLPVDVDRVLLAVEEALRFTATPGDADLTVHFSDDRQLQQLNAQFLGVEAPTDVLSFPADFIDPDSERPYLGDVVISVQRAQAQALEAGKKIQDELLLLVVHGVLHLRGYDHAEQEEQALMWLAQEQILSRIDT